MILILSPILFIQVSDMVGRRVIARLLSSGKAQVMDSMVSILVGETKSLLLSPRMVRNGVLLERCNQVCSYHSVDGR